jgi:glucose-1-phosphate cytidylyltransferase
MRDGEELVEAPFQRLIEANELLAYRHEGFWRPMDTLKDKQVLEDLVEQGKTPWLSHVASPGNVASVSMRTAI